MRGKTSSRRKLTKEGEFEQITEWFVHRGGVSGWVQVTREQYESLFPDKPIGQFETGNWKEPVISESSAVHPKQIKEAAMLLKSKGVPTEFLPDGRPILTSPDHKRRFAKARGYTCRDHFY